MYNPVIMKTFATAAVAAITLILPGVSAAQTYYYQGGYSQPTYYYTSQPQYQYTAQQYQYPQYQSGTPYVVNNIQGGITVSGTGYATGYIPTQYQYTYPNTQYYYPQNTQQYYTNTNRQYTYNYATPVNGSRFAIAYSTGDSVWGVPMCNWSDYSYGATSCEYDPQQWIRDPYTGQWY
jgi:hypothetical protein